jgi:ribosomal protein S18 acetylase RimI-like enzyme
MFRQLDPADLPAVLELQETVRQGLPHPHLFQCEEEAFYAHVMGGGGVGFGAFDGHTMAGYGIVTFPGADPENLCHDLPDLRIDPREAAHLDGSAVHPAYRGMSIQQRLSVMRIACAAGRGVRHFLMTVSPMNPYSLRNHLNGGGFRVRGLKQKFGGKWRMILHRELDCPEPASTGLCETCPLDDLAAHHRLLDAGFCGVRLASREGTWHLTYEKG